jgi:hypothetical protein
MPELPLKTRYFSRSSKLPTVPLVQTRKVLFLSGASLLVVPVMAPSCTDQSSGRPDQPARVLPSKSGT